MRYLVQELLFKCIQDGVYSFPEKEWSTISAEAQDLVQHLLVRDPHQRYTADEVLAHPWIQMQQSLPPSQLNTPYVLSRYLFFADYNIPVVVTFSDCFSV